MDKAYIDKAVTEQVQKLWQQSVEPLIQQLNSELGRIRVARENIDRIKGEIAKKHKEISETANQLAEAYAAVPAVETTKPASK